MDDHAKPGNRRYGRRRLAPTLVIAALLAGGVACGKELDDTATASDPTSQTTTSFAESGKDLSDLDAVRAALRATCASTSGQLEETIDLTGFSTKAGSILTSSRFAEGSSSTKLSTTQLLDRTGKPIPEPSTKRYELVRSGNRRYLRVDPASGGDGLWYSTSMDVPNDVDDCAFNVSDATRLFSKPALIVGATPATGPEGGTNAFALELDPSVGRGMSSATVTVWLSASNVDRMRLQTPGEIGTFSDTTLSFTNLGGEIEIEIPQEATEIPIDEFEAKLGPIIDDPDASGR